MALFGLVAFAMDDLEQRVSHHFADSGGVKIHYASLGQGPLVVMIHGFPDFWYSWRNQMPELAKTHRVVAMDLRGYNLSDKPAGVENYDMRLLVGDVAAVIRHAGASNAAPQAVVVGHDWGGAIAWQVAMHAPELVSRLIIVNLPHPYGLARELAGNPEQQANSAYARGFQSGAVKPSPEDLAKFIPEAVREKYLEMYRRSDIEAMMNYYKRNYPREPYRAFTGTEVKVKVPVLMFHGLKDKALLAGALNGTWQWVEKDLTMVTLPDAGHWSHWDAGEVVTKTMVGWLGR